MRLSIFKPVVEPKTLTDPETVKAALETSDMPPEFQAQCNLSEPVDANVG